MNKFRYIIDNKIISNNIHFVVLKINFITGFYKNE